MLTCPSLLTALLLGPLAPQAPERAPVRAPQRELPSSAVVESREVSVQTRARDDVDPEAELPTRVHLFSDGVALGAFPLADGAFDGRVELVDLRGDGAAYVVAAIIEDGWQRQESSAVIRLGDDRSSSLPVLQFAEGLSVQARVLDSAGAPVRGAVVSAWATPEGGHPERVNTHTKPTGPGGGTWVQLPPAVPKALTLRAAHHELGTGRAAQLADDGWTEIQLGGEGLLLGRLVDDEGRPFPGQRITARRLPQSPTAANGRQTAFATTGPGGEFVLAHLAPGSYRVTHSLPGHAEPLVLSEGLRADGIQRTLVSPYTYVDVSAGFEGQSVPLFSGGYADLEEVGTVAVEVRNEEGLVVRPAVGDWWNTPQPKARYALEPGRTYLVQARALDRPMVESTVQVVSRTDTQEFVIELPERDEPAVVTVELLRRSEGGLIPFDKDAVVEARAGLT
ncbi:MAG: carboxypeptidase-like regulatory domain-containing protein, partial [Planctomycetota bacterium]